MVSLQLLDRNTARSCLHLTAPLWHEVLLACSATGPTVAICYTVFGSPIGLVLAAISPTRSDARVLSLFVAPPHRGQQVATTLARRMEIELAALGCRRLHVEYVKDGRSSVIVERLLRKLGWEQPRGSHISCRIAGSDFGRLVRAPWIEHYDLPPEFEIFSWCEATDTELDALKRRAPDSPVYRERFDPFADDAPFEHVNSVGLRCRGEIVGWMLTRPTRTAGLLLYDQLYVLPRYQASGRAIPLMAEALKRHYERDRHIETMGAYFSTALDNAAMMRFVRRRFGPFLTSEIEVTASSKTVAAWT